MRFVVLAGLDVGAFRGTRSSWISGRTATPVAATTAALAPFGPRIGLALGTCFFLDLLVDERLPVRERYLVVVGMDFAEGEEAVAVAAILDERRLQGRLYPRDLGEVDVAA